MKKATMFTQVSKTLLALTLLGGVLVGCMQSLPEVKLGAHASVDEETIKSVNNVFNAKFRGGDWYYQGATVTRGEIYAYIQIPKKMNMDEDMQTNYLKKAICPSSTQKAMWDKVKDIPLSVHIYTFNKRYSVYADCDNPRQAKV